MVKQDRRQTTDWALFFDAEWLDARLGWRRSSGGAALEAELAALKER